MPQPFAKPGPYITQLPAGDEAAFQSWVKQNHVPFDPSPTSDYDMRGYYKDNVLGAGGVTTKISTFDGLPHFPDTYKTPYHKTFSNESRYATADAPHWEGDVLKDKRGNIVADETPKPKAQQAQTDPWEDAAKNFKPHQGGPAPTGGGDDWKIWQRDAAPPQTINTPGQMMSASGRMLGNLGSNVLKGLGESVVGTAGNIGNIAHKLIPSPIRNASPQGDAMINMALGKMKDLGTPANTTQGVFKGVGDTAQFFAPGETEAAIASKLPMLGRFAKPLTRIAGTETVNDAQGGTPGVGALMGATGELIGAGAKGVANLTDPMRPYRSPLIPAEEARARAAADVLKPNPLDYRNTVDTLRQHFPDVNAQTGGVFKNPLEFAKASGNAGKQSSDAFRELVESNRHYGQVGPSFDELQTINDKLRPIYKARSMGEQMTKEAQDNMAALEAQRDKLNQYMYGELSGRSGMPIEEIQALNQRGGALQHVSDVADTAQSMRRAGFSGYTPTGLPIPIGGVERMMRLASYLRGGPEASAGRQLTRIAKTVDGAPAALPDMAKVDVFRRMSDVDELSNLRRTLEQRDQNLANSKMRVATREPSPPVVRQADRLRGGQK